ncbi:hypothetical protein [Kribbella sp. NPDC048928]|uniref:hypothetical protein n=1 Tax=Kribbella sp. NPDC048928 TaxID=3364111 RepID=UPI003724BF02
MYYEDQVIKDGRETLAAALAVRSFELLAELETLLDGTDRAARYVSNARRLAEAIRRPLPIGYWDPQHERFVDWVDRSGEVHDHIHLLANGPRLLRRRQAVARCGALLRVPVRLRVGAVPRVRRRAANARGGPAGGSATGGPRRRHTAPGGVLAPNAVFRQ